MRHVLPLCLLVGCGDALVTRDYRGEALFTIVGRAADWRYDSDEAEQIQTGIFWSRTGDTTLDPGQLVELAAVETSVRFPAIFTINVFAEPDDETLTGGYYLGQLIAYVDEDGREGYTSPSELRGGASRVAVLFAPEPVAAAQSPTRRALERGFTQVNLPLRCNAEASPFISGEDCGVPLGDACTTDADCGAGRCLLTDGFVTFPGGYCSLPDTGGCVPGNGVIDSIYFEIPENPEVPPELYFYKLCSSDSDCRDGYTCAIYNDACLPEEPVSIEIYPDFYYESLCSHVF